MSDKPLVSVGIPVYNDAPWLRNALDHILAQDYQNLDIIIADDGSTDGSREICREFSVRDNRIRLFENEHNLGGWGNHRFVFDVSMGDFFAWGSGHDYFEPVYISALFEKLNINPAVLQCCPKSLYYNNEGVYKPPGILDTRGLPPSMRVKHLIDFRLSGGSMDVFFGLYRSEFLAKVEVGRDVVSADEIMLAELSFMGEILQIDEPLIHKINTRGSMNVRVNRETYRAHLDRNKLSRGSLMKEYLPRMYSFVEYMNMLEDVNISLADKEYLHQEIKNVATKYENPINEEIEYFLGHFKVQIPALEPYPLLKKIQSAHVLSALEFVYLLGFESEEASELCSICLSALENSINATTMQLTPKLWGKPELAKRIHRYSRKLAGTTRGFLGEKAWKFLRRILTPHFLMVIWIVVVMALYLLLFSPLQYWALLSRLGIAGVLDAWRIRIVELFDLAKGFH